MSYTDMISRFADLTEDECVTILNAYDAGRLDRDRLIKLLIATIVIRADTAVKLADLALATQLSVLRQRVVAPIGLSTNLDKSAARFRPGVVAAVAAANRVHAVTVEARSAVLASAQDAFQEGMQDHGVTHWARVPNTGACEVCQDLANGIVPIKQQPWFHKGCGCTTTPVEGVSE